MWSLLCSGLERCFELNPISPAPINSRGKALNFLNKSLSNVSRSLKSYLERIEPTLILVTARDVRHSRAAV